MMDVKGLAWFGNVCDKFEAMCQEMEEVMYEDTVKYVENQVQTVGASVKRFYSEVMQDLRPDMYTEPMKVGAADLSLNSYTHSEMKLNASAKKDAGDTTEKLSDDYEVISGKSRTGVYRRPVASRKSKFNTNFLPPASGPITPFSENMRNLPSFSQMKKSHATGFGRDDVILPSACTEDGSRNANEMICKPMVVTAVPATQASVNLPAMATETTVSLVSAEQKRADSASTTSSGGLSSESSAVGTCTNSGLGQNTVATGTDSMKSVEEEVILAHQERLHDCSMNAAKNDGTIDPEVEIIEPFNEPILEETCVLVEGDELQFVPHGKGNNKSYKKKLREAFSSRMRLKRKEYEQLAARYTKESTNQEGAERTTPDRPAESNAETLPAPSSETEWELL